LNHIWNIWTITKVARFHNRSHCLFSCFRQCVVIPTICSYTQEKVSKLKTDTLCMSTQTTSNVIDHETLNEIIIQII
jgi:hypothetical protein